MEKMSYPLEGSLENRTQIKLKTFSLILPEHKDMKEIVITSFESLEKWKIVLSDFLQVTFGF